MVKFINDLFMDCLTICLALAHEGIEHGGVRIITEHHLAHIIIFGSGFAFLIGYLIWDIFRKRKK